MRSQNFKLGYRQESPDAECVQEKQVYEQKLKKYFNETISINRNMIQRQNELRRMSNNIHLGSTENNNLMRKSALDENRRSRQP